MADKRTENSSWDLLSDSIAVKQTDLSALRYNEIRITNDVKPFFELDEMEKHERREIFLHFNTIPYSCIVYMDAYKQSRSKIRWGRKFRNIYQNLISGYFYGEDAQKVMEFVNPPLMRFEKIDKYNFEISFIFNKEIIENTMEADTENIAETEKYKIAENNIIRKIEVLKYHGPKCNVCGFDYLMTYGDVGKGREEIHLLRDFEKLEDLSIANDFVCLCSNCHRLLHNGNLDYDELNAIVKMNTEINKTFK